MSKNKVLIRRFNEKDENQLFALLMKYMFWAVTPLIIKSWVMLLREQFIL